MPWLIQMMYFTVMILGIIFALYIGFWLLLGLFTVGVLAILWLHLRAFLLKHGILNPAIFPPMDGSVNVESQTTTTVTTIEGDYKKVDSE